MSNKTHAHHGFAAYNKFDPQGALIGNYVEERALQDTTGCHRYPKWVDNSEASESVYARKTSGPTQLGTFDRVFHHSDNLEPGQWISQNSDTYKGPDRKDLQMRTVRVSTQGTREQRELERLYQQAAQLPEEDPLPPSLDTEQRTAYTVKDMTGLKIGAKVMRTQDGLETVKRDPTFLAEAEIIPRSTVDRLMSSDSQGVTIRPSNVAEEDEDSKTPYYEDLGVSLYSDAVQADTYRGTHVFGTKTVAGTRSPFARNCDFSKPMSEYNKIADDE
eukprot:jgi/Tetstr1/464278/TSEL_009081.t1